MKNKLFRRIASFLLVTLVSFTTMGTAFATETSAGTEDVLALNDITFTEYIIDVDNSGTTTISNGNSDVIIRANSPVSGTCPSNGSLNLYPWLESYIGLSKTFIVNATSNSKSGALLLYLYNPSGKLVSKDWMMGVNQIAKWSVTLPSSGKWRLYVVAQGTTASVNVFARWD